MASSQIQIPSAPYDHVLRDHNRRIRDRERECSSKPRFTFQKNIDELVRDHLNNCWVSNEEMNSPTFGMMGMNGKGENEVESEAMRRRQTRVIDRWATHQAKEMITTIERQTHEAELLALSSSQTVSERTSTFLRESSPAPSDSSVEVPNLRASSLVQMWKEFEAEAISPIASQFGSLNSNSNIRYRRLNSIVSNNENSSVGESPMSSETDDRFDTAEGPEDSFMEWESEQTATSAQHLPSYKRQISDASDQRLPSFNRQSSDASDHRLPSFNRQNSDASEGAKVAAIVKRLTSGSQTAQSSLTSLSACNENENDQQQPVVCEPTSSVEHSVHQGEQKFNRKCLRVRGRQATKDLLMQMEHERYRELGKLAERRAVSQFQQRGRIQSLLKLKFLQREVAVQDQQRPASTASELDQLNGRSSIFLLRERFSARAKLDVNAPVLNEVQNPIPLQNAAQVSVDAPVLNEDYLQTQLLNATLDSGNFPVFNEDNMQSNSQLLNATQDLGHSHLSDHLTSQDIHHEDVTAFEHSAQTVTVDHSMASTTEHDGQREYHSVPSTSEHIQESNCWVSDVTQQGLCADNLDSEGTMDNERTSHGYEGDIITEETELNTIQHIGSIDRWEMLTEEPDSNSLHLEESSGGSWLNDVSYPPRGWECRKQTWYDDGVEDKSEEEVHALLERRTVSNLLASSFRGRLDGLLLLHIQRHPEIFGSAEQEETNGYCQEGGDDPDQVASPSLQLPLPSCLRPWDQYQDQEVSDDSDQVAYTSLQPPQQSSSDYQDSQQCSPFTNHPSLEMELIYDLKGHIERLQYEMSELRESIKTCVGMQVNLQNSIKQEVAAAVCRSMIAIRGEEAMEFSVSVPKKKGNCCICCSMQVDSLLYRCGHMCTCFKCAHELQWNSSRCPICRAPILDVVRAYSDP